MVNQLELLKIRARSFKSTLQNAGPSEKKNHAGMGLALNFNKIVEDSAKAYPELASSLPQPIGSLRSFPQLSNASYLDLEVMADQLLQLLEVVDAK